MAGIPPGRLHIPGSIPRPARSEAGAGCAKRIRVEICAPVLVPAPSHRPLPLLESKFPGDYVSERNPARKYMHWLRIARARAQRYKV